MANTILTAEAISSVAIELLKRQIVLPATIARIPGSDFTGTGGTVSLRVSVPRTANEQITPGTAITYTDVDEVNVNVAMQHLYSAALLTDEDLALGLVDFGRQVLAPALAAVATGAEGIVAGAMNDVPATIDLDETDSHATVLELREQLVTNGVPIGDRYLAVAPDVATLLLDSDRTTSVDQSGSASALREATIGMLYGLRVVESNAIAAGTMIAYHRSAFAASIRPPVPASGADSASTNVDGIGVRVVRAFDVAHLSEAMAVSTFVGAAAVTEDGSDDGLDYRRAVKAGPDESS